jgi:hypothetical protein
MNKTIKINPIFFKTQQNTKRGKPKNTDIKIKVRDPSVKSQNLKRKTVLKFIRNQQDKNYKNLLTSIQPIIAVPNIGNGNEETEPSNFDDSIQYLMHLSSENEKKQRNEKLQSQSMKNLPSTIPSSYIHEPYSATPSQKLIPCYPNIIPPLSLPSPSLPPQLPVQYRQSMSPSPSPYPSSTIPVYGCMKNGNLPTYRQYSNRTQKQYPILDNNLDNNNNNHNNNINHISKNHTNINPHMPNQRLQLHNFPSKSQLPSSSRHPSLVYPSNEYKKKSHIPMQKRIIRRTFTVGKSKSTNKVSVLISNKTIRRDITTKKQLLRQIPIKDVRAYLVKHEFIKIGSIAPNDILYKMYESAIMMCGDVYNHNTENILHNYFNQENG